MTTTVLTEKMQQFLAGFPKPSNDLQAEAFDRLSELDFPTTRDEYWKYTRLGKIANKTFELPERSLRELAIEEYIISDQFIVIENGLIRQDLSQYSNSGFTVNFVEPDDLGSFKGFNSLVSKTDVFTQLNSAYFDEVIALKVAANQKIEKDLQLIFVSNGDNMMANNRLFIEAEKFSEASVVITQVTQNGENTFNNLVTEIMIGENAHFNLHKIQAEDASSIQMSTEEVTQAANSTFKINTISLSGLLVRNNINIAVNGENCETFMNGAVITKGNQHVDNHTFVDHRVPNCYSNENYKYVLDGKSTGVFNGRVVVRKDAQVINAYQNNGNILLSDYASINSKPELEIYADDVKCSHGSTTGQLDENALFYLQARGISKDNAKKILVGAFIGEVIDSMEHEVLTEQVNYLLSKIHGWAFNN
jgi:Fe-S cluster assembly protein SufD